MSFLNSTSSDNSFLNTRHNVLTVIGLPVLGLMMDLAISSWLRRPADAMMATSSRCSSVGSNFAIGMIQESFMPPHCHRRTQRAVHSASRNSVFLPELCSPQAVHGTAKIFRHHHVHADVQQYSVLTTLAGMTAVIVSLSQERWETVVPIAWLSPMLLWLA